MSIDWNDKRAIGLKCIFNYGKGQSGHEGTLKSYEHCGQVWDEVVQEYEVKKKAVPETTAFKNAGIKTNDDFIARAIEGEDLYFGEVKVFYDSSNKGNPFRHGKRDFIKWDSLDRMQVKCDWIDSLPEGKKRLCWVSNSNPDDKELIDYIESKHNGHYEIKGGDYWKYATPILSEELLK